MIFALELTAQNSSTLNLPLPAAPVASAVVQLLAIGPGDKERNQECSATGVLVNEEGYILTNAHVVEKAEDCLARSFEAKIVAKLTGQVSTPPNPISSPSISCDLVGLDDVHDLAIIKTERPFNTGAPSGASPFAELDATDVMVGAHVRVSGHPAFAWVALTQTGHIIGHRSLALFEGNNERSDLMILDISLKRGNSGSPIYRESGGGVIGIVERQNSLDPSQTLAVPIHYAINLLNQFGVKWHAARRQTSVIGDNPAAQ